MNFSLIVPIYNEEANVENLLIHLVRDLPRLDIITNYEIIFVDDGSTDNTFLKLNKNLPEKSKVIRLTTNYGQSSAIAAGMDAACFEIIGVMDADLQTDVTDFSNLLEVFAKSYHCVSGWRYPRKDRLTKKFSVWFAKSFLKFFLGNNLNDISSSMIVFKKSEVYPLFRFNSFHRYIPLLCQIQGLKVAEVRVKHRSRIAGKSKYGFWNRAFGFIFSLLVLGWMKKNYLCYSLKKDAEN